MDLLAFTPIGATVNLSVTSTTGRVQITDATLGSSNVRIHNAGASICFISFGDATVTAALTTSMPCPVGSIEIYGLGVNTYIAAITTSGTAKIYATPGQGA